MTIESPVSTHVMSSPIGPLRLVAEAGRLRELRLGADGPPSSVEPADPLLREAAEQLRAFFAGERQTFELPLEPIGTPFQRAVWAALQRIPFGETRSYADIARELGQPTSTRAVGAANGRNPLPIVIPCHRVIGADGTLTGYGGGLERKRWLLAHESRSPGLFTR